MKYRLSALAMLAFLAACGDQPTEPTPILDVAPSFNHTVGHYTATSMNIDFSGSSLDDRLEDPAGKFTVTGGSIRKSTAEGQSVRRYVRTKASNYNTVDFTAEVTFSISNYATNAFTIAYFGLGSGDPSTCYSTESDGALFRIHTLASGSSGQTDAAIRDNAVCPANFTSLAKIVNNQSLQGGTHRAQLTKSGSQVTLRLDIGNNGTWDGTSQTFSMPNFLTASNSRIYFGTSNPNDTFDDLNITVVDPDTDGDGISDSQDVEPTLNNNYYYVDWTSANPTGGTAEGTITLPGGHTVGVTFKVVTPTGSAGWFLGAQTNGGTNYWATNNYAPYKSGYVLNPPPSADIIQLQGGNTSSYIITFTEPVRDPAMAVHSLGGGPYAWYDFDRPFEIVSQGAGFHGGDATRLTILPGEVLQGKEGNGTIRFIGSFTDFTWTVPHPEYWHGFTFAIRGIADANADYDGDGIPDADDSCPLVANTGGDSDFDGIDDACDSADDGDADPDGDGLTNAEEHALGTNPNNPDTDGDTVPDGADACPLDPQCQVVSDATPPIVLPDLLGTMNGSWFTSDVTVAWIIIEDESEVTSTQGCDVVTVEEDTAGLTFTCAATSAGGTTSESVTIKRDASAPVITPTVTGTLNGDWYTTDVSVNWSVDEPTSPFTTQGCEAASVTEDTQGVTFTCSATSAGGTASESVTIKRDATAPVITPTVTGTEGNNEWYTSNVVVSWSVAESTSPFTTQGCEAASVTQDTQGVTFTCSATSAGGTASESVTVKRDATVPTITFTGATSYTVDQTVDISCSAADAMSGLASSTCPGASGDAYTFVATNNTLSASAEDNAGNLFSSSTSFTVSVTGDSLCTLVQRWVSNKGVANSMCQQLRAQAYGAFANHVRSQSGKKFLSSAHAAILIDLVGRI